MKGLILALLLALNVSGQVFAQNPWYLEVAVGQANIDSSGRQINQVPTVNIIGGSSCIRIEQCYVTTALAWPERDGDAAGRISVGRNFGRYFSVEAAYLKFQDFEAKSESAGFIMEYDSSQAVKGFNLSAGARYPITDALQVFAKAGVYAYNSETTDSVISQRLQFYPHVSPPRAITAEDLGLGSVDFYAENRLLRIKEQESSTAINVSLGASYSITQSLDLKLEYQQLLDVQKTDIDLFLIGLAWRF